MAQRHIETPRAWFSANLTGTSLGTVHLITQASHFRFTSKSPISASPWKKNYFRVLRFELAMAWMKPFIKRFSPLSRHLNQIKHSSVFGIAYQQWTDAFVEAMWAVSCGYALPKEIKATCLLSTQWTKKALACFCPCEWLHLLLL